MKKIILTLAFLAAMPAFVFAGSITLNYPDEQQSRIVAALTETSALCNVG